ncbi:MAG: DUF975 family protein [Oscillospiraceae bacterium]|nr:DUF975 family protein [Oscillospiraceae bacterium]
MFPRSILKERAKTMLRRNYWICLAACLMLQSGGFIPGFFFPAVINPFENYADKIFASDPELSVLVPVLLIFAGFILILSVGISIFVMSVLEVGVAKFFLHASGGQDDLGFLFAGFKKPFYFPIVKAMAWRMLMTFLWSLLFIIPGIVKSYAYSMVPYLLAENPGRTPREALAESERLTDGFKMELFVLDLSFIGWTLLGILACGVGVLFVTPYIQAAKAEAYQQLRGSPYTPPPYPTYSI